MPQGIVASSARACFAAFKKILDPVIGCLPIDPGAQLQITAEDHGDVGFIHYRGRKQGRDRDQPPAVFDSTRFGRVGLRVQQTVQAVREDNGEYRLQTLDYRYAVQVLGSASDHQWRWEYEKHPGPGYEYCRNHVHWDHGSHKDLHVPTGWVAIEDVVRFLIADLKVSNSAPDWDSTLKGSREYMRASLFPTFLVSQDPVRDAIMLYDGMTEAQKQDFKQRLGRR
jgi:hypothetical protein